MVLSQQEDVKMNVKKTAFGTEDDKRQASKALRYEWWMLNESAARIPFYENRDRIVYNALVECFCVHLRNFIEFFHRKKRRPFYRDFLPESTSFELKNKLDRYEPKVNDLLSHCTYKRLSYTKIEKEWHITDILNEVNENMFRFLDAAKDSCLCEDIKKYRKQFLPGDKAQAGSYTSTTSDAVLPGTTLSAWREPIDGVQ
jgi:hypothetical protein